MKIRAARFASIAGHPAVLMPLAAVCATHRADDGVRWAAVSMAVIAVSAIMAYSVVKARSGAWSHIDASRGHERSQLNRFASLGLLGFAAVLALMDSHPGVVAAIGLSGALILAAHLLKGRLKPSLHVGFAAFSACIVWPDTVAFSALLCATAFVAWSRLVLYRHSASDVVMGAVLGFACGAVFQVATSLPGV